LEFGVWILGFPRPEDEVKGITTRRGNGLRSISLLVG